jgi:hypothetical protein
MISAERGVDPAKRAQPAHERPELRVGRDVREPLVERLAASGQPVARRQVVDERQLGVLMREGLRSQPLAVRLRPRRAVPHPAVTQQQLREPVPTAHQIDADLLACPGEIPRGLRARRRDRDRRQRAGHQLPQQQIGVAAV